MIVFISTTGHRIEYVDTNWARRHVLPNLERGVARGFLRIQTSPPAAAQSKDRVGTELAMAA